MATTALSKNDYLVLNSVFDPDSLPLAQACCLIDPSLPSGLPHTPADELVFLQGLEAGALRPLIDPSPKSTDLQTAIAALDDIIKQHPEYASAHNNRAQALRLQLGDDLTTLAVSVSSLWVDLCNAVGLTIPADPRERLNSLQASILAAAHAQRGHLILNLLQRFGSLTSEECDRLPETLKGLDRTGLEEFASKEFEVAGRYGDAEAAKMGRMLNPYARLCGSIVREAMKAEGALGLKL